MYLGLVGLMIEAENATNQAENGQDDTDANHTKGGFSVCHVGHLTTKEVARPPRPLLESPFGVTGWLGGAFALLDWCQKIR